MAFGAGRAGTSHGDARCGGCGHHLGCTSETREWEARVVVQTSEVPWKRWLALRDELGRILFRYCQDESELDDLLQEVYLRAAIYSHSAPTGSGLRAWLLRIGTNTMADWRNKGRRYASYGDGVPDLEQVPDEEEVLAGERDVRVGRYRMGYSEAHDLLKRSMGSIGEGDRQILSAAYQAGRNTHGTARRCRIPARLVKGRLYRARRRLSKAMRRRAAEEFGA